MRRAAVTCCSRVSPPSRATLNAQLPLAGTAVKLSSGRTLRARHVLGGGLIATSATVILEVSTVQGDPDDVVNTAQGGFDAHLAPDCAVALLHDLPFSGGDTDADEADPFVTYAPEGGVLTVSVYGAPLDVHLTAEDRALVARTVLGAYTCTAIPMGDVPRAVAAD